MALIRYPGSKAKLIGPIWDRFPGQMVTELWSSQMRWEYREPFFGAGAIGWAVLREIHRGCPVWLNDLDSGMVALWQSVRDHPKELIRMTGEFIPSAETFYRFKEEDGRDDLPIAEVGFRKLALHRMSRSGFGVMAGGPIGGRNQTNRQYDVGCRWNPEKIKIVIAQLHKRIRPFKSFRFTCGDFATLIEGAPRESFIYADPPYYKQGKHLYKFAMTHDDHARLASLLRETRATWVLSYDDHPAIRDLYSWANIEEIRITYTCSIQKGGTRPKNNEIIITPANGV